MTLWSAHHCSNIEQVDAKSLGQRIDDARGRAGLTQADLAVAISLDRSALAKVEMGVRRVSALELARIAEQTGIRIEWLFDEASASLVSHRNMQEPGAPSPAIDVYIERLAREVEFVAQHDDRLILSSPKASAFPATSAAAEAWASTARAQLPEGPLRDLRARFAAIGLLVFSIDLGPESADAATILLAGGGMSIVNGHLRTGRRRLAAAHELGHYLVADDFTVDWRVAEHQDTEQREFLIDRFARALLLPSASMRQGWAQLASNEGDLRTAAVRIASEYRVDRATLARRLLDLEIITGKQASQVRGISTGRADIVELDLVPADELAPPQLPTEYEKSVLRMYKSETVSAARAVDLLVDTWDEASLPPIPVKSAEMIWKYVSPSLTTA